MIETAALDPSVRVVVVSDIHVGAGELDDFKPELEDQLALFLNQLAADSNPIELVVNGDCFDFVTAAPWDDPELEPQSGAQIPLCFTQEQSCRKLKAIIDSHGRVFDALAQFLAQLSHRLTILPGNHDADLFWPDARRSLMQAFAARGAATDRVKFVLERAYVIHRGDQRYWVEHGHQHDPPNSFFVDGLERWSANAPPILEDGMGRERLYECPGTLGLVRYINGWRKRYKSIGYIKPNSRILMALASHKAFKEPGRPFLVLWQLAHLIGWDVDWKTTLDESDPVHRACYKLLSELVGNLDGQEQLSLIASLAKHGIRLNSTLRTSVETSYDCDRIISGIAAAMGAATAARAVMVDDHTLGFAAGSLKDVENQALLAMATRLISNGKADYVVTGHTHAPMTALNGRFINGGCWVPNQEVDSIGSAKNIIFEHGSVPYRLTYVDIPLGLQPRLETHQSGVLQI